MSSSFASVLITVILVASTAAQDPTSSGRPPTKADHPRKTRQPTVVEAKALRAELLTMGKRDQEVRHVDYDKLSGEARKQAFRRWEETDTANTARIKAIVVEFGWPTTSTVGAEAAHAAFLLVQHADRDPEFQARCLPMLEGAAERGEVSRTDLAYLTDRVRKAQNTPQIYGTQYPVKTDQKGHAVRGSNGKPVYLLPIVVDVEHLDERRRAAGLGPWVDYERSMAKIHGREPAERPRSAEEPHKK